MQMVNQVEAVGNLGLKNDRHAIAESSRQVLLIEKEILDVLGLQPGQVKENITASGIAIMRLPYGRRLQIGREVVLEITKQCSPCSRMEEIRPGLLREIAGRRGILARVAVGGTIHRGDRIELLAE